MWNHYQIILTCFLHMINATDYFERVITLVSVIICACSSHNWNMETLCHFFCNLFYELECIHHLKWHLVFFSLQWRHNGRDSVSNHQPHDCFLKRWFRHRSNKTSKLRATGLCAGNSPEAGEFPAQMASNAENVSIWWRHHVNTIIVHCSQAPQVLCNKLSTLTSGYLCFCEPNLRGMFNVTLALVVESVPSAT